MLYVLTSNKAFIPTTSSGTSLLALCQALLLLSLASALAFASGLITLQVCEWVTYYNDFLTRSAVVEIVRGRRVSRKA